MEGSDTVTDGVRVKVFPEYLPQHSKPEVQQYVFAYRVVITNEGPEWAQLVSRHWIIINADGKREDVRGPGVVGYQPELDPGESFEYTSFCPLDTFWGTMEGSYQLRRKDGDTFDASIGRFFLTPPKETAPVEHAEA